MAGRYEEYCRPQVSNSAIPDGRTTTVCNARWQCAAQTAQSSSCAGRWRFHVSVILAAAAGSPNLPALCSTSPSYLLSLLSSLYATRSGPLWKPPPILAWLQKTAQAAADSLDDKTLEDVRLGVELFDQGPFEAGTAPAGVIRAAYISGESLSSLLCPRRPSSSPPGLTSLLHMQTSPPSAHTFRLPSCRAHPTHTTPSLPPPRRAPHSTMSLTLPPCTPRHRPSADGEIVRRKGARHRMTRLLREA